MCISLLEEAEIPHWKSMLGGAATPEMLKQISRLQSEVRLSSKLRLTPNVKQKNALLFGM
jgi:hypothetical protein